MSETEELLSEQPPTDPEGRRAWNRAMVKATRGETMKRNPKDKEPSIPVVGRAITKIIAGANYRERKKPQK